MGLSDVRYPAEQLAQDLATTPTADRLRLVFEYVSRWNETPSDQCAAVAASAPPSTGEVRWDALVAGLVEYLCARRGVAIPAWVDESHRFVDGAWWVVDTPLFRIWALHDTPAALLRHGVMLSRDDLERV